MKSQTLPIKRHPVTKGIFRRLSAVTYGRKQRASTAMNSRDMDFDDGSSKIARALTIILVIHVVAVAMIFIHHRFLDGRPTEQLKTLASNVPVLVSGGVARPISPSDSELSSGQTPYIVKANDSYASIADAHGIPESRLRAANQHIEIKPGFIMKLPTKAQVLTVKSPEVVVPDVKLETSNHREQGLVEAIDVNDAPKATAVDVRKVDGSSTTYVVKAGESIWGIANQFKVDQNALMKANGISDARKLRAGMVLKIP